MSAFAADDLRGENARLRAELQAVSAERDALLRAQQLGRRSGTSGGKTSPRNASSSGVGGSRLARRKSSGSGSTPEAQRADSEAILACQSKIKAATYTFGATEGSRTDGMRKLFSKYDKDDSGTLSAAEFKAALRKLVKLSTHQVSLLIAAVDRDGDRQLSIDEFINFIMATTPTVPKRKGMSLTAPERAHLRRQSLERITLSAPVQQRAQDLDAQQHALGPTTHADQGRDRSMEYMRSLTLESQRAAHALTGNGRDELLSEVELMRLRLLAAQRLLSKSRRARCSVTELLHAAFERFDSNGDGKLCHEEFGKAVVDLLGLTLRAELHTLFVSTDVDCSGGVTSDEFLAYLCEEEDGAPEREAFDSSPTPVA